MSFCEPRLLILRRKKKATRNGVNEKEDAVVYPYKTKFPVGQKLKQKTSNSHCQTPEWCPLRME